MKEEAAWECYLGTSFFIILWDTLLSYGPRLCCCFMGHVRPRGCFMGHVVVLWGTTVFFYGAQPCYGARPYCCFMGHGRVVVCLCVLEMVT